MRAPLSTVHFFCNSSFVTNIINSNKSLTLSTNAGSTTTTQVCNVKGLHQKVWYLESFITNILNLSLITKKVQVTYNSYKNNGSFLVHRPNKSPFYFRKHISGLHYYEVPDEYGVSLVNTVSDNMSGFSKRQIQDAKAARSLQAPRASR